MVRPGTWAALVRSPQEERRMVAAMEAAMSLSIGGRWQF